VKVRRFVRRNPTMVAGALSLALDGALGRLCPLPLDGEPVDMNPVERLRAPVADHWFGTDMYGGFLQPGHLRRPDLFAGWLVVAAVTSVVGLAIGLISGFVRKLDNVIMRSWTHHGPPGLAPGHFLRALTKAACGTSLLPW